MTISNGVECAANGQDPFALVAPEVGAVMDRVMESVATNIPRLRKAASHLLRAKAGKMLRPTLMLLMGTALTGTECALDVDHSPCADMPRDMRRCIQVRETGKFS